MDCRELRYFLAVHDAGGFSAAARQLGMAQPPISSQIKQLEVSLGVSLFDRSRRKVVLTSAGRRLLPEARKIIERLDRTATDLRDEAAGRVGALTLAVADDARSGFFSKRLRKFIRKNRGVRVRLIFSNDDDESDSDVSIFLKPDGEVGPTCSRIETRSLGFAVLRDHRLSKFKTIAPTDLIGETIILASKGAVSVVDKVVSQALQATHFEFEHGADRSVEERLWMSELGLGLTVCFRDDVERGARRVSWSPLDGSVNQIATVAQVNQGSRAAIVPEFVTFMG